MSRQPRTSLTRQKDPKPSFPALEEVSWVIHADYRPVWTITDEDDSSSHSDVAPRPPRLNGDANLRALFAQYPTLQRIRCVTDLPDDPLAPGHARDGVRRVVRYIVERPEMGPDGGEGFLILGYPGDGRG